jgi:hypothetical protein
MSAENGDVLGIRIGCASRVLDALQFWPLFARYPSTGNASAGFCQSKVNSFSAKTGISLRAWRPDSPPNQHRQETWLRNAFKTECVENELVPISISNT